MNHWQDAEKHVDNALEMFERERWAEAEQELRLALQIDPEQGDWHFNLGITLEKTGRDEEALASFQHAARLLPDAIDPQLAAGATCLRLGRFEASITWLENLLKQEPTIEPAWSMLIDANTSLGLHDEAETTFYLAQSALEQQSPSVLVAMSRSLCERQELDRAIWCVREALKIDEHVYGGRLQLASALVSSGKGQLASQILLQELREDPGNVQALLLHADVLAETGRTNEALIKLHRVLELEPANVEAHIRSGQYAMEEGRWEEAFIAWGLVRRLDPSHHQATLHLAQTLLAMHRPTAAAPLLQECIERLDDQAPIVTKVNVAELLVSAQEYKMVIQLLSPTVQTIKEMDELSMRLLKLLALSYFANEQIDEGSSISRKVLRNDPNCVSSIHNLALAALKNHRYTSAWGWVNRGLAIDSQDDDIRRLRSRLIWSWIAKGFQRLIGRFKF